MSNEIFQDRIIKFRPDFSAAEYKLTCFGLLMKAATNPDFKVGICMGDYKKSVELFQILEDLANCSQDKNLTNKIMSIHHYKDVRQINFVNNSGIVCITPLYDEEMYVPCFHYIMTDYDSPAIQNTIKNDFEINPVFEMHKLHNHA